MRSRVARIIRSVVIALSDPSSRRFLASTKARRLQRSYSKSSSRSAYIATSGFYLNRDFPGGNRRSREEASDVARIRAHHHYQPILGGIPGMFTIDHSRRDVWMRRKNHPGAAKSFYAAESGPWRR